MSSLSVAATSTTPSSVVDLAVNSILVAPGRKRKPLDAKKEKDQHFIDNINRVGFLQPITVRAATGGDKSHEIVFGLRRLAAAKYLGKETIPAQVVNLTDEQMRFFLVSENTMREQMDHYEYLKQMKMLLADLEHLYGPDPGKRNSGVAGARAVPRDPMTSRFSPSPAIEPAAEPLNPTVGFSGSEAEIPAEELETPSEKPPVTHTVLVQEATGRSRSRVYEDVRVASTLSEEHLAVLQVCENPPSPGELIRLAKIDGENTRVHAISLILKGNTVDQAIEIATANADQEAKSPKPKVFKEVELSDEDWLLTYAVTVRKQLKDPSHFDRAALLYRRIREALSVFRIDARDHVLKARAQGGDPMTWLMTKAMYVDHPDAWYVCGKCLGHNNRDPGCDQCGNKGFSLTFREPKNKR